MYVVGRQLAPAHGITVTKRKKERGEKKEKEIVGPPRTRTWFLQPMTSLLNFHFQSSQRQPMDDSTKVTPFLEVFC